jgi:uncharacterized protein (TIGR03067 family)
MMKCSLCLCLSLVVSPAAFAAEPPDAKAIQGSWMPVKAELSGQPMAEAVLKTISLKLTDGKYEVHVGAQPDNGTYTLDDTTKPKSITITGTDGPNRGRTFPAIYELRKGSNRRLVPADASVGRSGVVFRWSSLLDLGRLSRHGWHHAARHASGVS